MSDERRVKDAALVLPSQLQIAWSTLLPITVGGLFALGRQSHVTFAFVVISAFVGLWMSFRAMKAPRVDAAYGELTVNANECSIGGHTIARSEIRRARIVNARGLRALVLLDRGFFRSTIGLRMDYPDAHALVKSLELDAGRVRDRFKTVAPGNVTLARWAGSFRWLVVLACLAFMWVGRFRLGPLVWWPLMFFVLPRATQGRVDIGPDGLTVRWYAWTWHAPLADITAVTRTPGKRIGYHVHRKHGPPIAVMFGASRPEKDEASAFEARINELLAERDGASPILIETFEKLAPTEGGAATTGA